MPLTNSEPREVMSCPFRAYIAPYGTAYPLVSALESDPSFNDWELIGKSGDLNMDRDAGVLVQHTQEIVEWLSAGDTGARKAFRTKEGQVVKFTLVDFQLESYRHALNGNSVSLSTPGERSIGLSRGVAIRGYSLLFRAEMSPYEDESNSQYEIPLAYEGGSPEVALAQPGKPAGFALEWRALVDPNAVSDDRRFGRLVTEDATVT